MVNQTIQIFARLKPTKGKKGVSTGTCSGRYGCVMLNDAYDANNARDSHFPR